MAPLPENFTARLFVDYNDGVNNHTISMRYNEGEVSKEAAVVMMDGLFAAADGLLYEVTIIGARYQLASESVTNPVAWTGAATYGDGAMPVVQAPREVRFLGRSPDGRKVSWSFFGANITTPDDWRLGSGENADVAAVIAYIESEIPNLGFLAIGALKPLVYPYADVNYNSYWEQAQRG